MTNKVAWWARRIVGVLLSLSLVVAGGCLIAACLGIYYSGDPYSREAVRTAFAPIAVPVYLCLGLVMLSTVLHLLFPEEPGRLKAAPDARARLRRMYARTDVTRWPAEERRRAEREQTARRIHGGITLGLSVIGTAVFLVYALNPDHFSSSDVTGSVVQAVWWLLPCCLIPCGYGVFTRYYGESSLRREMAVLSVQMVARTVDADTGASARQAETVKAEAAEGQSVVQPKKTVAFPEMAVRYALLAVGLLLLVYGFATGGIADVLTKAVNICTECIGLG